MGIIILSIAWLTVPFTIPYAYIMWIRQSKKGERCKRELALYFVLLAANLKCNRWIL